MTDVPVVAIYLAASLLPNQVCPLLQSDAKELPDGTSQVIISGHRLELSVTSDPGSVTPAPSRTRIAEKLQRPADAPAVSAVLLKVAEPVTGEAVFVARRLAAGLSNRLERLTGAPTVVDEVEGAGPLPAAAWGTASSRAGTGAQMSFSQAVRTCLVDKYADFSGRASRAEYWWFVLLTGLVVGIFSALAGATGQPVLLILGIVVWVALIVPTIAAAVRRLHDTNRSGWWYLIGLVPFIGGIVMLVFLLTPGKPEPNDYGPVSETKEIAAPRPSLVGSD